MASWQDTKANHLQVSRASVEDDYGRDLMEFIIQLVIKTKVEADDWHTADDIAHSMRDDFYRNGALEVKVQVFHSSDKKK